MWTLRGLRAYDVGYTPSVRLSSLLLLCACTSTDAVRIQSVVLGQNTGVLLVADGQPVLERNAPVVAGREAQLRLAIDSDRDRDVEIELLAAEGALEPVDATLNAGSTVVELTLPAASVVPGQALAFSVRGGGARSLLPEPAAYLELGVREIPALQVEVVELTGSIAADVSPARLDALAERLVAMFPVDEVQISLRSETLPLLGDSRFASSLNVDVEALVELRDGTPPEVLTLGLYGASATGAGVASDHTLLPHRRVAVAPTLDNAPARGDLIVVHELGHLLGAQHAPCEIDVADPAYPQQDGSIGVFAWDSLRGEWRDPSTPDVMGYCNGPWIGPHSSGKIAEGLQWSW